MLRNITDGFMPYQTPIVHFCVYTCTIGTICARTLLYVHKQWINVHTWFETCTNKTRRAHVQNWFVGTRFNLYSCIFGIQLCTCTKIVINVHNPKRDRCIRVQMECNRWTCTHGLSNCARLPNYFDSYTTRNAIVVFVYKCPVVFKSAHMNGEKCTVMRSKVLQ